MSLAEIKAAADALPREQKEKLFRFLASRLNSVGTRAARARVVQENGDVLLEAPAGAPPMTAETVRRILEDWP
jgi:hypothetical protein